MDQRNMKTVLMLDRSAKFGESCNETFDIAIREGPKQKKLQIDKTMWTWCLEGIFEMHRVLSDVYPRGSVQLRFALADHMGKMLDTEWKRKFLTRAELGALIESVSIPTESNTDITPLGGLTMAIEALAVETPEQKDYNYDVRYNFSKRTEHNSEVVRVTNELKGISKQPKVENHGNLILYTRLKTEEEMAKLQKELASLVVSRNSIATSPSNKTFCPITSLRVFIVNYYAKGDACTVKTHPLEEYPNLPFLRIWVISRKASDMCNAIHSLLVAAFDLGSTTVTKIPMKEDNRGSTNYDVELFHSGKVHTTLREQKLVNVVSKNRNSKEGVTYDTMRLTWTTAPKTKWSLFPYHKDAVTCTTAKAYSRPSACLTQFVRDGRCVMLDSEKTAQFGMNLPDKLVSHILIANRGRIFIQEIDFMQKKNFPKRRDYGKLKYPKSFRRPKEPLNIEQLKHTYKQLDLKLVGKNRMHDQMTEKQAEKWKKLKNADIHRRLLTITKNIPMYSRDTFIFNKDVTLQLEPLVGAITKLKMTPIDVEQCNTAIIRLHQMRELKEFIIPKNSDIGPCSVENLTDPEEQMRVAVVELAKHMAKYVTYSDRHKQIYKTFMSTMGADKLLQIDPEDNEAVDKMFVKFPFFGNEMDSDDSDESSNSEFSDDDDSENDEEEAQSSFSSLKTFLHTTDSDSKKLHKDLSQLGADKLKEKVGKPIVMAKEIKINIFSNMCDMVLKKEALIRREFVGRELHGNKAPLYPQLAEKLENSGSPSQNVDRVERVDRIERTERPDRIERNERTERFRNLERGSSGTPPPRRPYN
uniref:Protein asunder n=2 Tax=Caenorhabditis tropicalis TaxID=1561998 RepID=A0A1I7TVN7_9PELO